MKIISRRLINDIAMIALALLAVALLFFEIIANLTVEQSRLISLIDTGIALVFLTEFGIRLRAADNRKLFFKRYWWELLAAIPITNTLTQSLRALRLLRLVYILRMFRLLARIQILLKASQSFAKHTYLVQIFLVFGFLTLAGAAGFHMFEGHLNPDVSSFWDSIWWSLVTITTVGYGDIVPITLGGRLSAVVLMLSGIGIIGLITASIAAYIIQNRDRSKL